MYADNLHFPDIHLTFTSHSHKNTQQKLDTFGPESAEGDDEHFELPD